MKKYHLFTIIILVCGLMSNAQNLVYGSSSKSQSDDYNRISMSFRNVTFWSDGATVGFNGGGFNYIHGFRVSETQPMYIETGASLNFTTKDYGSGSYGGYGTIDVPVNFAYRFSLPNSEIKFVPSIGLDFKGNIVGTSDVATDTQEWYSDYSYKRFQLGWQINAGMEYKKLYLALGYGTDFIQIVKKLNTGTFSFTIGLNI